MVCEMKRLELGYEGEGYYNFRLQLGQGQEEQGHKQQQRQHQTHGLTPITRYSPS